MILQAEEESKDSIDAGGGSAEMIYMEYLEAWGAISEYKYPNPYIPLVRYMLACYVPKQTNLFANLLMKTFFLVSIKMIFFYTYN